MVEPLSTWTLSVCIFQKALAVINFFAFQFLLKQVTGLIGSRGILPAANLMQRNSRVLEYAIFEDCNQEAESSTESKDDTPASAQDRLPALPPIPKRWSKRLRFLPGGWRNWLYVSYMKFYVAPTLCWISSSDAFIRGLCWVPMVACVCAMLGIFPSVAFAVCFACYLSLIEVSGEFMSLQMHFNVTETNFLAAVCGPFLHYTPFLLPWCIWILLFRVMFGGGAGKWAGGDPTWRKLRANEYHYWTQPLPNSLAYYMHRLPKWVHKFTTALTFVIEGPLVMTIFAPQALRFLSFFGVVALMMGINVAGSFGSLGPLSIVEALLLLNDNVWRWLLGTVHLSLPWSVPSFLGPVGKILAHLFPFAVPQQAVHLSALEWVCGVILPWLCIAVPYTLLSWIPFFNTFYGQNPLTWIWNPNQWPLVTYRKIKALPWVQFTLLPRLARLHTFLKGWHAWAQQLKILTRFLYFAHMTTHRWEIIIEGSYGPKSTASTSSSSSSAPASNEPSPKAEESETQEEDEDEDADEDDDEEEFGPSPHGRSRRRVREAKPRKQQTEAEREQDPNNPANWEWKEYVFQYKPDVIDKRAPLSPVQIPGLDWRLWFLPLEVKRTRTMTLLQGQFFDPQQVMPPNWFLSFLSKLLNGEKCVVEDLMAFSPFPLEAPPKYIRAILYDYRFAWEKDEEEKKQAAKRAKDNEAKDPASKATAQASEGKDEATVERDVDEDEEDEEDDDQARLQRRLQRVMDSRPSEALGGISAEEARQRKMLGIHQLDKVPDYIPRATKWYTRSSAPWWWRKQLIGQYGPMLQRKDAEGAGGSSKA